MYEYLASRFAGILTINDVVALFRMLIESEGNRLRASEKVGITTASTYAWKKANFIKTNTKNKVLTAALEENYLGTIEYLLKRTTFNHSEILRTLLVDLYNSAVDSDTSESFLEQWERFNLVLHLHRGIIRDTIEEEVIEMREFLRDRATELKINISEDIIEDLSARELLTYLPVIVSEYRDHRTDLKHAVETIGLSENDIRLLWSTFKEISQIQPVGFEQAYSSGVALGFAGTMALQFKALQSMQSSFKLKSSPIGLVYERQNEHADILTVLGQQDTETQFHFASDCFQNTAAADYTDGTCSQILVGARP